MWDSELNDTKNLIHHLQMQLKSVEKEVSIKELIEKVQDEVMTELKELRTYYEAI